MDLTELWTNLIRQIKSYPNVNASQIDAFFSRVQLQAASQGFVMFTSDNSFIKDWIEKHYIKDIQQALHDMYGMDFIVQIEVDPTSTPIAPLPESAPTVSQEVPVHHQPAPKQPTPTPTPSVQREAPFINQSGYNTPEKEVPNPLHVPTREDSSFYRDNNLTTYSSPKNEELDIRHNSSDKKASIVSPSRLLLWVILIGWLIQWLLKLLKNQALQHLILYLFTDEVVWVKPIYFAQSKTTSMNNTKTLK